MSLMEKKPAGVSGGLGGWLRKSLHGCVEMKHFLSLVVDGEKGNVPMGLGHFGVGEGKGLLERVEPLGADAEDGEEFDGVGVHGVVRLVDGANLPRLMISATHFSCGRTIVLQALI
jgi:hypothetical protein